MKTKKNRWLIALSAIAIHLSIGAGYAYSVYTNPISDEMGWAVSQVTIAFTIMMGLAGFSAAFFGSFVEKQGPRRSALLAAVLFSLGQSGSGLAIVLESLPLFLLTYGLLSGLGLGIGYISPVSTLVKWFPNRRGLATGMAVLGFGIGSLLTAPVAAHLIGVVGISSTFFILGASYFILMVSGASYIAPPPKDWVPEDTKNTSKDSKKETSSDIVQLTAKEAVKTKRFWMLWSMMLINTTAGVMIISVASPMGQELVGLTAAGAATMVGIMGLFNGGGRLGWAAISDYLGRTTIFMTFFIIQVIAFAFMPFIANVIIFQLFIFLIVSCYGGGFSNLPAAASDLFGTKSLGSIHGYLLTTWSLGGIFGPIIASEIHSTTGSYIPVFYLFAGLMAFALLISVLLKFEFKKLQAGESDQEGLLTKDLKSSNG
ncbi:L-lactate MFS transporter [Texcoconibacillus texcoconensis]|uniref:OFA family oxalate/formate antiporter-like MFS transporter n=1 Tax=Texcoconibacillus texcoconensis TaxID=1095777 RepID=A0A840QTZ7_9BACI|nr:OFA family MFS transporter [Texcoconibacillus texcoconensis]MBB5174737.1 OFA family oxalate/formate antiporter-like MFS transporter [Texcoconibacillus texcoconensis]